MIFQQENHNFSEIPVCFLFFFNFQSLRCATQEHSMVVKSDLENLDLETPALFNHTSEIVLFRHISKQSHQNVYHYKLKFIGNIISFPYMKTSLFQLSFASNRQFLRCELLFLQDFFLPEHVLKFTFFLENDKEVESGNKLALLPLVKLAVSFCVETRSTSSVLFGGHFYNQISKLIKWQGPRVDTLGVYMFPSSFTNCCQAICLLCCY